MKSLNISNIFNNLQASNFIKTIPNNKTVAAAGQQVFDFAKLSSNGLRFSELLLEQWQSRSSLEFAQIKCNSLPHICSSALDENQQRLAFLTTQSFGKSLKLAQRTQPLIIKTLQTLQAENVNAKFLISEFFLNNASGSNLDKFYSIQREQKIWWMRFSANPSRYCLEAYDFPKHTAEQDTNNNELIQSIDIKAKFYEESITLEHLTYVPHGQLGKFLKNGANNLSLIRSVVSLNDAVAGNYF